MLPLAPLCLSSKYHLNIVQAYLPTSSHTSEEVDTVYEEIDNLVNNNKVYHNIVMGDFNAKIGQGNASELGTGPYGLGTRNARGDSLINFTVRHQLKIMNIVFKRSPNRRWTWISPNGHTKNEIDFILTNRPHTFTDVSVINSLNTGSDHRMVRGFLTINTQAREGKAHPTMQETKHSGAVSQHHKTPNATHQQIQGLSNINRPQLQVRECHLCNYWDCYGNCWSE